MDPIDVDTTLALPKDIHRKKTMKRLFWKFKKEKLFPKDALSPARPETIWPNELFYFSEDERDLTYFIHGPSKTLTGPAVYDDGDFVDEVFFNEEKHRFEDTEGNPLSPESEKMFVWEIGVEKMPVGICCQVTGLCAYVSDVPGQARLGDVKRIFDSNPANEDLPYSLKFQDRRQQCLIVEFKGWNWRLEKDLDVKLKKKVFLGWSIYARSGCI